MGNKWEYENFYWKSDDQPFSEFIEENAFEKFEILQMFREDMDNEICYNIIMKYVRK